MPDMKTYHVQQSKATAQVVMFMLHSLTLRGKPSCYTHVVGEDAEHEKGRTYQDYTAQKPEVHDFHTV